MKTSNCLICKAEGACKWKVPQSISIKRPRAEEYEICRMCSMTGTLAVDYMQHYSACGGCTLDIELPWVQTIASWNIKNGPPCRIWRSLPSEFCNQTDLTAGDEVRIQHDWAHPWSRNSTMHDHPLDDLVIYIDLDENDNRVMYDTTRSIYLTYNTNEEMVILYPGTIVAKVDQRSRGIKN